jgi:ATP-dependent Clp protease ATP-binding subunit ClpC
MQASVQGVGSARSLLDRASAIAQEKCVRVSTLHIAAAWIEQGGEPSRVLVSRGCRTEDLRLANKVHTEEVGTIERIQSRAKRIAAERKGELSSLDLVLAALTDKHTALTSWVQQLGCEPNSLAEEVYRATIRAASARVGAQMPAQRAQNAIISGPATNAPPVSDNARPSRHPSVLPPHDPAKTQKVKAVQAAPTNSSGAANPPANNAAPTIPAGSATGSTPPSAKGAIAQGQSRASGQRQPKGAPAKTPFDIDSRTFPAVTMFARNLSAECARGVLEPVVGREKEVGRVLDAVGRRDGKGALVVGAPGVGKSTLLRAVARSLESRSVLTLRHADVAAQARGQSGAERSRKLVEELVQLGDKIVLALDPISPWFLTRDVPDDVVLELRAALTAGKIAWIGACTPEEARKLSEVEPWMDRHASRLGLEEPSYAPLIATHHGVRRRGPSCASRAELSDRYLGGRAQPDRASRCSTSRLSGAKRSQGAPCARRGTPWRGGRRGGRAAAGARREHRPRAAAGARAHLAARVVGHRDALARVAARAAPQRRGLSRLAPDGDLPVPRPHGRRQDRDREGHRGGALPGRGGMTRFDMAEFSEAHSVARLVGAPPGYVGYARRGAAHRGGAPPALPAGAARRDREGPPRRARGAAGAARRGRITDGRGRTTDFRNTVIVMTSNLGAEAFQRR